MKTTIVTPTIINKPITYPCVMKVLEFEAYVLFHEIEKGVVIYSEDSRYSIGYYTIDWIMKDFIPVSDITINFKS